MVDAGYVKITRETFEKFLDDPEVKKRKREKLSPERSLELIKGAGGIPVLAHPIRLKTDMSSLSEIVKDLSEKGLVGMECYYSTHSPKQTVEYLKIAKEYGLYATASSDFHRKKSSPK